MEDVLILSAIVLLVWAVHWLRRAGKATPRGWTPTRAGRVRSDGGTTTKTTAASSKPTRTRTKDSLQDPTDTAFWLRQRGWKQVSTSPEEKYRGHYRAGDAVMAGGLIRTRGGRRKFLVHEPSKAFERLAHHGRCLKDRPDLGPDVYEVHFEPPPDSFGDGVKKINAMLERADA